MAIQDYTGAKVELTEGGRVVATLYPQRRELWLWADCLSVRVMLTAMRLNVCLVPARECNAVYTIDRKQTGRLIAYMKRQP